MSLALLVRPLVAAVGPLEGQPAYEPQRVASASTQRVYLQHRRIRDHMPTNSVTPIVDGQKMVHALRIETEHSARAGDGLVERCLGWRGIGPEHGSEARVVDATGMER